CARPSVVPFDCW
nr:immunoglobulin heavy chain junction region [Mus musculus]